MMLLDTHVLVWLDAGSDKLGKGARRAIESAFEADELAICSISFWELAMLQQKGRIALPPLRAWREELLDMGLREIAVDGEIGLGAAELQDFHPDPADRLIVAAAMRRNAVLVSADARILEWQAGLARVDARS
ncbi:MAG: type II toxin-antitoxin system VapC family toxin [Pseudomonadota bacterium]